LHKKPRNSGEAGAAPPTGFVGDDVPEFIMATDIDAQQTGTVALSSGTPGSVHSAFAPDWIELTPAKL
jgi:hypothetical protein